MRPPTLAAPLALVLLLVPAASPRADDKPEGDLARLQGIWEGEIRAPQPGAKATLRLRIDGRKFTLTITMPGDPEARRVEGRVKVDESTSPKQIDLTDWTSPEGQKVSPDMPAIYKLEGGTLTLCPPQTPNDPRPTEFAEETDEGPPRLLVLKQQGPE